jgi:hypothetical protein
MSAAAPSAPTIPLDGLAATLAGRGHAVLAPADFARFAGARVAELDALRSSWEALPPDAHLRDGGRYRRRRHASFVVDGTELRLVPQRAHWQPIEYNALHGGLERWFEPIEAGVIAAPAWRGVIMAFALLASRLKGARPWFVEAHQFRIDTTDGIGRPTPEGRIATASTSSPSSSSVVKGSRAARRACSPPMVPKGSASRCSSRGPHSSSTMRASFTSTPIQPLEGYGHRDTLVLTYRAGSFQGRVRRLSPAAIAWHRSSP